MATYTSPARNCRQSLVQLVARTSVAETPQRSSTNTARSETPVAEVDNCVTRGLLACGASAFVGLGKSKKSIQRPLNAGRQNRGGMLAEFKKRVKAGFYMPA